jgi:hypothetical protein
VVVSNAAREREPGSQPPRVVGVEIDALKIDADVRSRADLGKNSSSEGLLPFSLVRQAHPGVEFSVLVAPPENQAVGTQSKYLLKVGSVDFEIRLVVKIEGAVQEPEDVALACELAGFVEERTIARNDVADRAIPSGGASRPMSRKTKRVPSFICRLLVVIRQPAEKKEGVIAGAPFVMPARRSREGT